MKRRHARMLVLLLLLCALVGVGNYAHENAKRIAVLEAHQAVLADSYNELATLTLQLYSAVVSEQPAELSPPFIRP